MPRELILEIGTEEIPAGFMEETISSLRDISERRFQDNLLSFDQIETFGTPRRLTLRVTGLSDRQKDRVKEVTGPPKRIAFDQNGEPTKAAVGFAKSQGVHVGELVTLEGDKGDLVAVIREIKGEKTEKVLKELLPEIILSIPFRKSMRWGNGDITFVRPIRWILSIYGGETLHFNVDGIKSGSRTHGHRFVDPEPFEVKGWNDYAASLKNGSVILDQKERMQIIKNDIDKIAHNLGGVSLQDEELLETVTHLVEYPVVLSGSFNTEFLELPKEVLISVMKNHQKYFPVFSNSGNEDSLLPHFIFVCGTPVKNNEVVIRGNERVIRARFSDAKFFFDEDTSVPLSDKVEKLKGMVFLSDLGTYFDKTERLEALVRFIGERLRIEIPADDLKRAAHLSKADLASQMVFEFPELQGVMGKYYARISGEKNIVSKAVEEQYMPASREGKLPETVLGAILSIADKADTISACFTAGLTPTGTSDPYALRRQAIGIINIILHRKYNLDLIEIFSASLDTLLCQLHEAQQHFSGSAQNLLTEIVHFMIERFKHLMIPEGFSSDTVDAVISAEEVRNKHENRKNYYLVEMKKKIEALEEFRTAADFESLGIAFKRVVNIVKEQPRYRIDTNYLINDMEQNLYKEFLNTKDKVKEAASQRNYVAALSSMKELKEPIDNFFDNVMVMAEDEKLRQNRLSLLWNIKDLFFQVADFSKLNT